MCNNNCGSCCSSCNHNAVCINCENVKKNKSEIIDLLKAWNKLGITNTTEVLEKINELILTVSEISTKVDEINEKVK